MAITTFSGIYSGPVQLRSFVKNPTTGSSADNPTLAYQWTGYPGNGIFGPNLSGAVRNLASAGGIPFQNAVAGQNTYLSALSVMGSGIPSGKSQLLIDVLWISSAVSQVTTTQTVNSVAFPSRDIDGGADGRGVYIAMFHNAAYTGSVAYTATITYTNSSNIGSKTGTVSRSGGVSNRWVPFGLANGDEGVRSVQDFTFSALPGTVGSTVLLAYRPIIMCCSQPTNGNEVIEERAFTLGLPRIYDDSFLTVINFGAETNTTAGSLTLAQG